MSDCQYSVTKLGLYQGNIRRYDNSTSLMNIHKSEENKGNGFLLIFNSVAIGVVWNKAHFFLFDSHSRDASGHISECGTSVLLQFRSLAATEKYIKSIYLNSVDYICYEMQYIQFSFSPSHLVTSHNISNTGSSDVHFV